MRTELATRGNRADLKPRPVIGDTIALRDGRRLGFAQFGNLSGLPVVFFHGGGDSRLQRHADDAIAESIGVRLITIDRPGIGLSDFRPYRRLLDWPDDVGELADALGLDRFAVLGYSNGGPHALACAFKLPYRLSGCAVVSGVAPFTRPGAWEGVSPFVRRMFLLARPSPWVVRPSLARMARQVKSDPRAFMERLTLQFPEPDRTAFIEMDRLANQAEAIEQAARQGARGLSWELSMLAKSWRFRLEGIRVPVAFWYGDADRTTPLQMGEYLARTVPGSTLTVWPGEGHQGMFAHWREVLESLAEAGRAGQSPALH